MQLVLEIDNPIVDINNKMAAVEQNSLINKPLTNGDISQIVKIEEKINADCADIKDKSVETVEDGVKDETLPRLETVSVDAEENVNKDAVSENSPQSQLKEIINNEENDKTASDLLVKETGDAQAGLVKENLQSAQDSNMQTELEPMDVDCVNESLNDDICSEESELNQSLSSMVANIVKDLEDTKAEDLVELDLKNGTSDAIQESKKDSVDSQVEIPTKSNGTSDAKQESKKDSVHSQVEIPTKSIDAKINEGNTESPIVNNDDESNHIKDEKVYMEDKNTENIVQTENVGHIEKSELIENNIASKNANSEDCMQTDTIDDAEIHMPLNKDQESMECEDPVKIIHRKDISDVGISEHLDKDKGSVECKDSADCTQTEDDNDKNSVECKDSADNTQTEDDKDKNSVECKHSADCTQTEDDKDKNSVKFKHSADCLQTEDDKDKNSVECNHSADCTQTEDDKDKNSIKCKYSADCIQTEDDKDKNSVECKHSADCTQTEDDKDKNSVECKHSADCTQTQDIGDVDLALHLNNDKVSGEGEHSADCNQYNLNVTKHDIDESKIEVKVDSAEDFGLTKEAETTPGVDSIIQNDEAITVTDEEKDSDMVDISEKRLSELKAENDVDVNIKEKTNTISSVDITEGNIQDAPNATTSDDNDIVDLVGIDDNTESKLNFPKEEATDKSEKVVKPVIQLSNTLDILSDDEDSNKTEEKEKGSIKEAIDTDKQCINLVDDDDIMLIDEEDELVTKDDKKEVISNNDVEKSHQPSPREPETQVLPETAIVDAKDTAIETPETKTEDIPASPPTTEVKLNETVQKSEKSSPLIPEDFFKGYRKNLADMTRDDLEEFCLMKIVESIIDRSNLNEIRTKMKTMAVNIEDYKKKAMMLTKQNRDLQVVLKSIQEEQKKNTNQPIVPLKITRSVGMQVLMTEKTRKRHMPIPTPPPPQATNNSNNSPVTPATNNFNRPTRSPSISTRSQKVVNAQIPVPRLVPAANTILSKPLPVTTNTSKNIPVQNGVKIAPLLQKAPEKRTHSRMQSQSNTQTQSDTVDLTDDEPPSKVVANKNSPTQSVRLLYPASPNMVPRPQFGQTSNSPRKVYIPITGPGSNPQQAPPVRGQTIMLKTISNPGSKGKDSQLPMVRVPQNAVGVRRVQNNRHPAPLPLCSKQYQPPNWKSLPPAPDLKLSKVENGIVISWKIEGYREDSYEEIASYQLFAYQEPPGPPSTSLWKKIGDVKALPLPMACTLTQFMAGFKYYFAVRAVDVRSRFGPFSLPGSILLLNKM